MMAQEAIEIIRDKIETCEFYFAENDRYTERREYEFLESLGIAISALKEIQQYRKIGTVEEFRKSVREDEILKFYYCESEDDYYIGKRIGNFYYARYGETGFEWFMSRYLPWGEHVVSPHTLWKEYTYPSKPKEIPFFEWLQGFLKKYCGGTMEECRKAVKQAIEHDFYEHYTKYHDTDQRALIDMVMDDIDEIPVAFDKEKVIEELRNPDNYTIVAGKHFTTVDRSVDIVEKGGIG